jgi:hypothetical protein
MEINPSPVEYPLYPYQKRKEYEVRLKEAFPIPDLMKNVEKEIEAEDLKKFREFKILVKVHKLSKVEREARRYIKLYEDYLETALPELWEREIPEPRFPGFEIELIKPRTLHLPYWYRLFISPELRKVRKKMRRMIDYSRIYWLNLRLFKDYKKWLLVFFDAFFYCQPIHQLDLIELELRAITFDSQIKILAKHALIKKVFRMPIWGEIGFEEIVKKKLREIFSNSYLLSLWEDQLKGRYPFVWCLTLNGEPIPRRKELIFDEKLKKFVKKDLTFDSVREILEFFEKERKERGVEGLELYRSADKRGVDKVDILILEYDSPMRMENENLIWREIVEDEERSLQILIDRGLNPKSVEENFSGNKSLQRLIHINPSISYIETRDIQYFLAAFHKFEAAKDSYFYTLDKESGLARITKTLPDYTYGRKKEIKCVPVPNLKKAPIKGDICCSIPLEFSIENGKIKFADWVFNLKKVREFSRWENVKEKLSKDEWLPPEEKLFKPQSYYEKNATDPAIFRKLMKEFYWYERARKEIPPYELDLWNKRWIKERFAQIKTQSSWVLFF